MANIVHFAKSDITARTTTSTAAVELTDYTITWANLTGAGFAAGDDVIIIVGVKTTNSDATNNGSGFAIGFGTTFAGRVEETDCDYMMSPFAAGTFGQFTCFDRRTLVDSENIYFRGNTRAAGTATYQEFRCLVLKLGDLTSSYFAYSSNNPGTNTPAAYDTSGASISIPATGDWLIFGMARVDVVTAAQTWSIAIHNGTSDLSELTFESEDTADFYVSSTMAYQASLASGTTVRVRHKSSSGTAFTTLATKIFALRLDAFEDHAGVQTANTVTMTVLDQYEEFASPGAGSYSKTSTGPFVVMGLAIVPFSETTKRPYGRITIAETEWPSANANRLSITDQSTLAVVPVGLFGYAASQGSGTLNIDLDVAEDADVAPNPTCTAQIAAAFSLTLGTLAVDFTGNPGIAALSATGLSPSPAAGHTLEPGIAAATITGFAPSFVADFAAAPGVVATILTGFAPTVPTGLSERLTPNEIVSSTNLKDTLTNSPPTRLADIDEETGSDDGEWWTAVNPEANIDVLLGFPTSSGNLVGTQTINVLIRGTSLPSRDWRLDLYENGSPAPGSPTIFSTGTVSSIVGQVVTLEFQPTDIADITGAGVQVRIRATAA